MLRAFATFDEVLTVGELALLVDVHKSTASRLAGTLAANELLRRGSDGEGYRLGPEVVRLGQVAGVPLALATAAEPVLHDLVLQTGETAVLSVASGSDGVDVLVARSPHAVCMTTRTGNRTPLHACCNGKVFLAFGAGRYPDVLERRTPATITTAAELEAAVGEVRRLGWAAAIGEWEEGLNGVAAPVYGASGACVAAVSVGGPAFRVSTAGLEEFAAECRRAAGVLSARLGADASSRFKEASA